MHRAGIALACVWLAVVVSAQSPVGTAYDWQLPKGMSPPPIPADNPLTASKIELGRYLFYDGRLSGNQSQSCATCHAQSLAFTDGRPQSVGSTGESHPRSSMSLVNIGYAAALTWANGSMTRLEAQALVPMYGEHPVELGLDHSDAWLDNIKREPVYQRLFPLAFPGEAQPFTVANVTRAIACFQRTIVSFRSPYDRYHFDRDDAAISESAKRGEVLFHSRPLSCFTCHGGPNFSSAMGSGRMNVDFHNTGLYNLAGPSTYPASDTGLEMVTKRTEDMGRFKPPTLRNIAVTAPYMHDGSIETLEAVIDHYAAGGRTIATGPNQGNGSLNPNKSPAIHGFAITADQKVDLIAFLKSLTDDALLHDPKFSNPWMSR